MPARLKISEAIQERTRPAALRTIGVWTGLSLLAAAVLVPPLRVALMTHHHLLSAIILAVLALILTPARLWPLALVAGAVMLWLLRRAMMFKEQAVGLPITYLDLSTNVREPHIVLRAVGFHGSIMMVAVAACILILALFVLAVRLFGRPTMRRLGLASVELCALVLLGALVLGAAGRDLRDRLPTIFPQIALDLWEPEAQTQLERRVGPLDYLAYTYVAGDGQSAEEAAVPASPLPHAAIAAAATSYVRLPSPGTRPLPNIVIFHAESSFDPNLVFRLTRRVDLPLWSAGPDTRSVGPLAVNIVGGGSQVTEFEILTGVDSRGFGYQGFYTHQTIGPRVRRAFPSYLRNRGYETEAFYTETSSFFGAGAAFRRYGFDRFLDQGDLGLRADWTNTDADVIERVVAQGAFAFRDRPRLLFISSLENHGPHPCVHFRHREQFVTSLAGNADFARDCSLNEYIRRARSTSSAVLRVLAELKRIEAATGRPYVLLVYGDHQPWSFTDGNYSTAAGPVNAGDMRPFARFRRGRTERITFYHLLSSVAGVLPASFDRPVPATLLPTLVSAYVARSPEELYLPVNLFAYSRCGTDHRSPQCRLRSDMQGWTRDFLFAEEEGSS